MRNSKANPVKARVNPARSRKRINNAKAEAKQVGNSKANPDKASVPAIRKIRKQPKAVMASRAARTTNPTGARTATATPVAAAAARTCSGTWTTLISTAH